MPLNHRLHWHTFVVFCVCKWNAYDTRQSFYIGEDYWTDIGPLISAFTWHRKLLRIDRSTWSKSSVLCHMRFTCIYKKNINSVLWLVKGMIGSMVAYAMQMLSKWEEMVERGGQMGCQIRVDEDLKDVSTDVISRVCFGSSFFKGKKILYD